MQNDATANSSPRQKTTQRKVKMRHFIYGPVNEFRNEAFVDYYAEKISIIGGVITGFETEENGDDRISWVICPERGYGITEMGEDER